MCQRFNWTALILKPDSWEGVDFSPYLCELLPSDCLSFELCQLSFYLCGAGSGHDFFFFLYMCAQVYKCVSTHTCFISLVKWAIFIYFLFTLRFARVWLLAYKASFNSVSFSVWWWTKSPLLFIPQRLHDKPCQSNVFVCFCPPSPLRKWSEDVGMSLTAYPC